MNTSGENFIKSAVLFFNEKLGLELSYHRAHILFYESMRDEWESCIYNDVSPSFDTCVRETLMDILSKHYLNEYWPCYADKIDMNNFYQRLSKAVNGEKE